MPSRIVREGILDSVLVNALSEEAELFYRRLMSITDDAGRFDDRPELIRARCFPLKLEQWPLDRVKKCLSEVSISRTVDGHVSDSGQPLVTRYRINGRKYLQINNFGQRLRVSKFPGPDDDGAIIEQCPSDDGHESVNRQHQSEAQAYSESNAEAVKKELPTGVPKTPPPIKALEPVRHAFGEFKSAMLSEQEHQKLEERLGPEATARYIARFDRWVSEAPTAKAGGVKRRERSAYRTILNWFDSDGAKPKQNGVSSDGRTKQQQRDDADDAAFLQALAEECDDRNGSSWVSEDLSELRRDGDSRSSQALLPIAGRSG